MLLKQTYIDSWSLRSRILFRFIFSYFLLYIFLMFASGAFEVPFRWIGKTILKITYNYEISGFGSGDNTYAYITLLVTFTLAIISTILWSLLQSKKKEYNKAFYWYLAVIRVFIILAMLLYGFVKVFQIQFQPASFVSLLQPLGEFSPMGLAWQYMGYSKGFGLFAGLMEILGGVLLIWRRTATLGAFVVIGVMSQVAMMNLMFDIPVKIFSIHLILMAGIIFITDIKRFVNVFFKNKPTEAYQFYHPISSKSYHKTITLLKKIIVPLILILGFSISYIVHLNVSDKNHRPPFYGIWEVETFVKNNDTIPPLINDNSRWRYLIIERKNSAIVKTMTDKIQRYAFIADTLKKEVSIYKLNSTKDSLNFRYSIDDVSTLVLTGKLKNDSLKVKLKSKSLEDFRLVSRKFHWINERPFNR